MLKMKNFTLPGMELPESTTPVCLSIGPLFDLLHAEFLKGKYGETIVNGGLPPFTAVIGSVNNYKTMLMLHMTMMALTRIIESGYPSQVETLDTEISMKLTRILNLAKYFDNGHLSGLTEYIKKFWHISDTNSISTNEWVAKFEKLATDKEKDKSIEVEYEAFLSPLTGKAIKNKIPTFLNIDTFTKFTNDKAFTKVADNDLDDSATNTLFMNIGMFKKKFLLSLPRNLARANIYAILTAHVGEKISIESGPSMYIKPSKQLQYLKGGDEIEGGTKDFKQAPNLMFQAHTAKPLTIKNNKGVVPEYPIHENDASTDLNIVTLTVLRNKSGHSGISIPVIVSQSEGVKPWLSAFRYLVEVGKFGISGNNISYYLDLIPDIKLQRTTVRKKIDENPKLRRALEFTSDMFQLIMTRSEYKDSKYIIHPEKLYNKIKDMGYDWDILLSTREYTLIDNYNPEYTKYLSTPDLLDMYLEEYHPWWYPTENIKNSYLDKDKIQAS